jgi:hypothetical protein
VIAFLAAASALALMAGDEIARVDDTPISGAAFAQRADALRARRAPFTAKDVLDSLVDEAVLANEARRLGLAADPVVAERLAGERRHAVAAAFVRILAEGAKPTDEELRKSFHSTADFVRAQVLSYATQADARAAADRVRKGATVASEKSRAKSADVDGPFKMRAELDPKLAAALFSAAPGAITDPVQIGSDWAIASVVEVVKGDEAAFAASRPVLVARLQGRAAESARTHFVSQALSRTPPKIDEAFLAAAPVLGASADDLRRVVATVGEDRIPYGQVAAALRALAATGSAHASAPEAKRRALRAIVEEQVLAAAGRERGVDSSGEVKAQLALSERGVLASAALERIVASTAGAEERRRGEIVMSRVKDLRKKAKLSVDRTAFARAESTLR